MNMQLPLVLIITEIVRINRGFDFISGSAQYWYFYFILPDRQRRCLALDFFRLEHTQVES